MINKKLVFYSLLFFQKNEKIPNLSKFYSKKKELIYCKLALNLAGSIHKQGFKHILITNNKSKINELIHYNFPIQQINFKKLLNKKTKFYSAHFKIDVIKILSQKKYKSCLLDLDILITKKFSKKFLMLAKNFNLVSSLDYKTYNKEISLVYKILCNLNIKKPKWYGGEFILGDPIFFKKLYSQIMKIYPNYKKNLNNFFHVGDETLLNSALQILLIKKKILFKDIKNSNIIIRYWSILNTDIRKLSQAIDNIFLHLPSDKFFLSKINTNDYSFNELKKVYINYHQSFIRILILKLKNLIKHLLNI